MTQNPSRKQSPCQGPGALSHGQALFVAEKHGAWLGWGEAAIRRDFDRARRADLAGPAADAPARATAALLGDVRRCFNDEWEPHGEMLNP